jgi:hypothetical protein
LDDGRIALDGPAGAVLEDERLVALGVDLPSRVRVATALASRGLDPAAVLA